MRILVALRKPDTFKVATIKIKKNIRNIGLKFNVFCNSTETP